MAERERPRRQSCHGVGLSSTPATCRSCSSRFRGYRPFLSYRERTGRQTPVPPHPAIGWPALVLHDLLNADIVFAGGDPASYLPLSMRVREARPTLSFVVVARHPEINEWLDAIHAGATDYLSMPIERGTFGG